MSGITVQLDTMPAPVMAAHCRGLFEAIGSFFFVNFLCLS